MEFIVGKDDNGKDVIHNLDEHPVVLMAGHTGSGKSNIAHGVFLSLTKRYKPEELKFVLADCKHVEFTEYSNSSYLYFSVLYCSDHDYDKYSGIINIIEERMGTGVKKPFIFIILDEYSDLAVRYPSETDDLVEKVVTYGSKAGIGLLLYTSRPGKDVLTRKIDRLVKSRIGLETASEIDSVTIIHRLGCTELKQPGEGLYLSDFKSKPIHFQAPYISEQEINRTIL